MQLDNQNLISLKWVLFCFLSGVGCIFPFLPLHMLSVGLDRAEARLISAVVPCIALLGPALLGPLIDKLSVGRGSTGGSNVSSDSGRLLRIVTAICLIFSALFYTLLLFTVPYSERHEVRRPQVLFMCDGSGAYVMQEVCNDGLYRNDSESRRCNRWSGKKNGVLTVGMCEYGCADENLSWVKEPYSVPTTTTSQPLIYNSVANATETDPPESLIDENEDDAGIEKNPPHICYNGECMVYMAHIGRMELPLSLVAPESENSTDDEEWCTYRTAGPSYCQVPPERLIDLQANILDCNPAVRCLVLAPYDEPHGVLADAECHSDIGNPTYTFWSYFILRVLSDIWPISALALLGTAIVVATRETSKGRSDVGRQLACGTIGLGIFPPLAGLAARDMPDTPFLVPFLMHAAFMLIAALILIFDKNMPLSTPEWWWHTATGVLTMPMNAVRRYGAETAAVFAVVTLLGTLWGGIDSYLPWTVVDVHGTSLEVGLTMTIGAAPALPALWYAEAIVDYIGHSNVFITAFIFYCIRYTGLAYTTDYTCLAIGEALEVFTLSLVWVTAMLYFRHLVPRKYTATGQALPVIAHFCLGRSIGAIIGGMVSLESSPQNLLPLESARDVYRGLGVFSLLAAAIYLALYHLVLAPKCASPAQPPPQHLLQGLNTNGSSNGTYSPMRVYHEERSRKGHFRY